MFYGSVGNGNFTGSIDNVSVKEYLGQEVVPNSGCGSWLFEPQSTNLITYSEDFSNAAWSALGTITRTSNYGISPDGTNNSTRVQGDNTTTLYLQPISTSGFARSIYVKATSGSGTIQMLSHNSNTNNIFTIDENWKRVEINSLTSNIGEKQFFME